MSASFQILFTDLDGTLLDESTYAFEPALPAIRALQERGIPIVFCTSKTFAETVALQEVLGITDPFIVENG
ncbi:MAG: HAD-IIB family hydrolase, partial [Holophaga sp.]|nr:HAD-IIB family hydrolase [Holophaga sp.]